MSDPPPGLFGGKLAPTLFCSVVVGGCTAELVEVTGVGVVGIVPVADICLKKSVIRAVELDHPLNLPRLFLISA